MMKKKVFLAIQETIAHSIQSIAATVASLSQRSYASIGFSPIDFISN